MREEVGVTMHDGAMNYSTECPVCKKRAFAITDQMTDAGGGSYLVPKSFECDGGCHKDPEKQIDFRRAMDAWWDALPL